LLGRPLISNRYKAGENNKQIRLPATRK